MAISNIVTKLEDQGVHATQKRGQYYIRLPNTGEKLKLKTIKPESFARAEPDDKYVVRKESLSGNVWAEYFSNEDDVVEFVLEKLRTD